jgi:hypothetical protein
VRFDLIELNVDDLRREPLVSRKAKLSIALRGPGRDRSYSAGGTGAPAAVSLGQHIDARIYVCPVPHTSAVSGRWQRN